MISWKWWVMSGLYVRVDLSMSPWFSVSADASLRPAKVTEVSVCIIQVGLMTEGNRSSAS